MATMTGLRILHKNVALNAALRYCGIRNKRIPKRIIYYSRYATQLNFLRWSASIIHPHLDKPLSSTNSIGQVIDLPSERNLQADTSVAPLFHDQQEYSENSYIYRHIHKRLDKFADIGNLLHNLPINSSIVSLRKLVSEKDRMPAPQYRESLDKLMDDIVSYVKMMNQQELAILLTAIKNDDETEYRSVKKMIDIELRWLLKKHVRTRLMELDLWFYLADIFYECLLQSSFVHVLVNYLTMEKEVTMTNSQFLHLLFLVILKRNQNGILSNYEQRTLQILNKASFEDIATICLAYFKTQTPITDPEILRRIIDKTAELLPEIDFRQPGYCSIIKSVRYSRCQECRENVLHLIMTMVHNLDCKMIFSNPYNAVHTIKLMETYRIYDRKLLDLIATTMFRNLSEFRIKDIQYALTSLSNFGYKINQVEGNLKRNLDRLCEDIVHETRFDADKQAYHLLPILRAFSIFGYYNDKLIDYVNQLLLNQNKLYQMRKVLEFERSALLVYSASRIEGNKSKLLHEEHAQLLNDLSATIDRTTGNNGTVKKDASIKHLDFILKKMNHNYLVINNLFRDVATSLAATPELMDPIYKFNFQYTLPHQNYTDLIISRDFQEPGHFDPKTLMPQTVPAGQKHCLILGVRKVDYLDGHGRLCGYKQLITRLLTQLGYTVVHMNLDTMDIRGVALRVRALLDGDGKD